MISRMGAWLDAAVRKGCAIIFDGGIALLPDYLDTVGYCIDGFVLAMDFGCEAEILAQCDRAALVGGNARFSVSFDFHGFSFIVPLPGNSPFHASLLSVYSDGRPVFGIMPLSRRGESPECPLGRTAFLIRRPAWQ